MSWLTMQVLDFSPMNESLSTWVSLLARNGRWAPFLPKALMHSLRANNDLLISAPSMPANKKQKMIIYIGPNVKWMFTGVESI